MVSYKDVGEMLDQLYAYNGLGGCCFGKRDGSITVQYQRECSTDVETR
jgi:hypothetical protein